MAAACLTDPPAPLLRQPVALEGDTYGLFPPTLPPYAPSPPARPPLGQCSAYPHVRCGASTNCVPDTACMPVSGGGDTGWCPGTGASCVVGDGAGCAPNVCVRS